MWATIKLTALGKKLVENREYRFLSPVFSLNDKGEPIDIDSIAFTNKPAFKNHIEPILNTESNEILTDEKDILSMDINELKKLILDVISEKEAAEKTEEIKEEITEEIVENKCSDEMKEVVTNEETTEKISEEKTEVVEETTEEKPVEETEKVEEEKEEVIKIEALNSAPTIKNVEPEWKNLKGEAFFKWLEKHPKGM
jgi:phage I-like protein